MRKIVVLLTLMGVVALAAVGASYAVGNDDNGGGARAVLTGYQETPSISTVARGDFRIRLDNGVLKFRLRYRNLEGTDTLFAHIHFAERHVSGAVVSFLCGGGGKPDCPDGSADIEGTIAPADVGVTPGSVTQGIGAGQFDELVRAIRAGATYANVHTNTWTGGELRGQIKGRLGKGGDED